jgi:arginase
MRRDWDLAGVPYTSASRPGGIADAIGVLRGAGLADRLIELGVEDLGDLTLDTSSGQRGPSGLLNERSLRTLVATTRQVVASSAEHGRKTLLVGGDCPVLLGPLAALAEGGAPSGLVMFDGHEDAWSPTLSGTGEASDSELGIAIGKLNGGISQILGVRSPLVDAARVALLGPRDAEEIAAGGETSIRDDVALFMDDRELVAAGGGAATRAALDAIGDVSFWVHVDLDVLETLSFGAVDYPQPGGITWPVLEEAFEIAVSRGDCRGASVAIYNPDLDPDRTNALRVVEFIVSTMRSCSS